MGVATRSWYSAEHVANPLEARMREPAFAMRWPGSAPSTIAGVVMMRRAQLAWLLLASRDTGR
jgi:hypothetical protein